MTASRVSLFVGVASVVFFGLLLFEGREYFCLSAQERPMHPQHPALRSSGSIGLACGVSAMGLFLLNLTYLFRRRLTRVPGLGSLRSWMSFHVLTGLVGAGFAVSHSALLPRSSFGILALVGLGIVVLSGLVGRYIYTLAPHTLEGSELSHAQLAARVDEHRASLEAHGVETEILAIRADTSPSAGGGVPGRLSRMLAGSRAVRSAFWRLRRAIHSNPDLRPLAGRILPLALRFARDQQWLARYAELRGLVRSWRFFHRWMAVLMLVAVVFHVALALRFGDL